MVTGLKIVLPISFSDASLPILYDDAMMNAGSLLLIEPAHSSGPLTSVPATTAGASVVLRNIARKTAAALTGGLEDAMDASFAISAANTASSFMAELTGKGAIHGIISQVNHTVALQGASINVATPIRDYMYSGIGHSYYFSRWARKTRSQTTSSTEINAALAFNNSTTSNTNCFFAMTSVGTRPTSMPQMLGTIMTPGFNTLGNIFQAAGAAGFSGVAPASAANLEIHPALWGTPIGLNSSSFFRNVQESYVLYRMYIEDLTVSGRSYGAALAQDQALWAAAMTVGGRYYGDTFTDPSSLP